MTQLICDLSLILLHKFDFLLTDFNVFFTVFYIKNCSNQQLHFYHKTLNIGKCIHITTHMFLYKCYI